MRVEVRRGVLFIVIFKAQASSDGRVKILWPTAHYLLSNMWLKSNPYKYQGNAAQTTTFIAHLQSLHSTVNSFLCKYFHPLYCANTLCQNEAPFCNSNRCSSPCMYFCNSSWGSKCNSYLWLRPQIRIRQKKVWSWTLQGISRIRIWKALSQTRRSRTSQAL